jgi:hypothetical protein
MPSGAVQGDVQGGFYFAALAFFQVDELFGIDFRG